MNTISLHILTHPPFMCANRITVCICFDWPTNFNFISNPFIHYFDFILFSLFHSTKSVYHILNLWIKCILVHMSRLKYKTKHKLLSIFLLEQTVNELCSDDPYHTRVQCALVRHMLEIFYMTVLLYGSRNVLWLMFCFIYLFFLVCMHVADQ